jgi:ketosteroid isomerase-like protein
LKAIYDQQDVEALERQFNAAMEEADTGASLAAVKRIYDEFDRASSEGLSALLHPDFELRMETVFLDGKTYRGVRGFLNWRRDMGELFEEERFQAEGLRFAGRDRWVVLGRFQFKGAEEGDELDVPLAHVFEQRDRKVARFTAYSDISEALASLGLL